MEKPGSGRKVAHGEGNLQAQKRRKNPNRDTGLLFELRARAARADVVEGDRASAEKNEGECEGGQSHPETVSVVRDQPVVRGHLPDSDAHINANGESSYAGKQAQHYEQPAKEFGEGREVRAPAGQTEAADQLNMVVQSAENLVVTEIDHDRAESQAHDEEGERLQTIHKAQGIPPAKDSIDYSSRGIDGSKPR